MNKLSKALLKQYCNQPNWSDIETIGFEPIVHTTKDVHVLANIVVDPDTQEEVVLLFHDRPDLCGAEVWDEDDKKTYIIPERVGTLMDGFRYWYQVGQSDTGFLSVHNAATFDKMIVEKVVPKCVIPNEKWDDTFISSKIQFFDRPCPRGAKSAHGLDAYGRLHGIKKPPITDYTVMDKYMLHRVIEDCKIQRMAALYLDKERRIVEHKTGITFGEGYKMEFEYALICAEQERFGAKVDVPHIMQCLETWDEQLNFLEDEIEPQLPPTVKAASSTKVTRKELAALLGYPQNIVDRIPEPTTTVKRNGEEIESKIKPYAKPLTKWTNQKKANQYSGMHISHGFSPSFLKKKGLTDWIKENHEDTKPSEWEITKKEVVTELVNAATCKYFDCQPEDLDLFGGVFTKVKFEASRLTQHEVTKGVLIKSGLKVCEEWNVAKHKEGGVKKAKETTIVSYPPKAAPENQMHITIKKGEALVTSPKFSEKDLEQVEGELGTQIKTYNTTMHRRRYLSNPKNPEEKGLLAYVREDGRVPAGLFNFGTATGRAAHRIIVNLPSDSAPLGYEMRKCVVAEEGKELVGIDQKSSQLSIAAFVTNNESYYNAVATGVEFKNDEDGKAIYVGSSAHCLNSRYFNLVTSSEWENAVQTQDEDLIHSITQRRKSSKGLSFASLFGCGAKKLAVMGGFEEDEAASKLEAFLDNIGLSGVIKFLEKCKKQYARGKGFYIPSAFGYWIYCEGDHKSVNYLIQSIEAGVQKKAVLLFEERIKKEGWEDIVGKILDVHDEILVEVPEGMGVEVGIAACECFTEAGVLLRQYFLDNPELYSGGGEPKITCDFAGGYAVGKNYAECH